MVMPKKAWRKVTEHRIQNSFRKSGISLEAQEGATDDHDDPFKGMVDDSAVDELTLDLNQLRKATPDLAPKNLDTDGLVDSDRELVTNVSLKFSVDVLLTHNFHNLLKPLKMASVMRMRFLTNPYHHC